MSDLPNKIMNIPVDEKKMKDTRTYYFGASAITTDFERILEDIYKAGHRDARHAAADLFDWSLANDATENGAGS
jgi:hypothetical protein